MKTNLKLTKTNSSDFWIKQVYDELYDLSFNIYDTYKKVRNQNINLYEDIENCITNNKNIVLKIVELYLEE